MRAWIRPYRRDGLTVIHAIATVMAVAGLLPLCGLATRSSPFSAWIPVILFVALFETVLWRGVMVGLYVSDRGIGVCSMLRTQVVPWSIVDRVWVGPASNYNAFAVWISVKDSGRDVETPIWRQGTTVSHRNRHKLNAAAFAQLVDYLNSEVARRTGQQQNLL